MSLFLCAAVWGALLVAVFGKNDNSDCPSSKRAAKMLSALKPGALSANGCGPQGMQVSESFGLWRCCNRHDVCFSSCDISFDYCESMFKKCMKDRCAMPENKGKQKECQDKASGFSSLTGMFGRGSFANSMTQVCDCLSTEAEAEERRREWVIDVYNRFGPQEKAQNRTLIDELMKNYNGKQGKLYFDLIKKYGAAPGFVQWDRVAADFTTEGAAPGFVQWDRVAADFTTEGPSDVRGAARPRGYSEL
eukprot:TRINITY_DN13700_c0_g1_i1.p1 TRINITY_DN13700_c0_g1~~TRINITY_DN13700_c0_g1_i1.p1  ORF type:complete len:248 (-),score=49.26 TRINITY_DN13700_c0_g1_i1:43-786(-)